MFSEVDKTSIVYQHRRRVTLQMHRRQKIYRMMVFFLFLIFLSQFMRIFLKKKKQISIQLEHAAYIVAQGNNILVAIL